MVLSINYHMQWINHRYERWNCNNFRQLIRWVQSSLLLFLFVLLYFWNRTEDKERHDEIWYTFFVLLFVVGGVTCVTIRIGTSAGNSRSNCTIFIAGDSCYPTEISSVVIFINYYKIVINYKRLLRDVCQLRSK